MNPILLRVGPGEGGGEGSGSGSEEGSGAPPALDETFDMVRSGARLIINYEPGSNSFVGTVHNTTNNVLTNVRIEVHLSDGTELGPTTPINLGPDEMTPVTLRSTQASFTGWVAHAEVGGGEGGHRVVAKAAVSMAAVASRAGNTAPVARVAEADRVNRSDRGAMWRPPFK